MASELLVSSSPCDPGYINVKCSGAIGQVLVTTGTINAGSNQLTLHQLALASVTGWIVDAGIGIVGAGPANASLVTKVVKISGKTLTLAHIATNKVTNALVTSDDSIAIQAAVDSLGPHGGTVFLPAGTYIIGTEGATTNQPIFVGSNIRLLGSGRGATTLQLPNNVKQAAIGVPGFPAASIFINKGNTWWFKGDQQLPLPSADSNVSIAHMTLDGNKDGQTSVYMHGNQTKNPPVPDPFGGLNPKGVSDVNGRLAPGDFHLCVTYADLDGKETGKSPTYDIQIDATQNAIEVGLPPIPSEAKRIIVYIALFILGKSEKQDANGNDLFERQDLFPLPLPNPNALIVTAHDPLADKFIPPGTGILKGGEGGAHDGIYLDQISDCYIHDLEIRNCVLDGLAISFIGDGVGPITVRDSLFEAIWSHDNGRTGMTITGNAESLRFEDCWMDRNRAWGFDIEPVFPQNPIRDIHFLNCRFSSSGLAGIAIAPIAEGPVDNLSLTNCELDGNTVGLGASAAVGKLTNCRLIGCTFRRNRNVACIINAPGYGLILGCDFDQNSAPEFTHFPNYIPGSAEESQLVFEDNTSNWRVIGNRFRPCPLCTNSTAINPRGNCGGLIIVGNHFDSGGVAKKDFVGSSNGQDFRTAGHIIHSNTGDGYLYDSTHLLPIDMSVDLPLILGGPLTKARNVLVLPPSTTLVSNPKMAIMLPTALATTDYQVAVTLYWDAGGWWISNKTTMGFTINWAAGPTARTTLDWTLYL
jgi:Right handed beta helix region/Pectate lyase superfamily protein